MNGVPNSDSEQCTESKLSRVHSAPILGPACTHTTPCRRLGPPGHVAGLALQCRSAHERASASCRRPCAICHVAHRIVSQSAVLHALYAASWRFPWPCCTCLVIQPDDQAAFLSRYNLLYRDTLPKQPSHRAQLVLPHGPAVSQGLSTVS